jgi:hypothetical protein
MILKSQINQPLNLKRKHCVSRFVSHCHLGDHPWADQAAATLTAIR